LNSLEFQMSRYVWTLIQYVFSGECNDFKPTPKDLWSSLVIDNLIRKWPNAVTDYSIMMPENV